MKELDGGKNQQVKHAEAQTVMTNRYRDREILQEATTQLQIIHLQPSDWTIWASFPVK